MRTGISLLLTAVCSACATGGPADMIDPQDPEMPAAPTTCEGEPKYADGTCHFDLACGIPDIDCFQQFASDDAARTELLSTYWAQYYTLLPSTDAHYAKARAQLDKSWELFKSKLPMDKLADKRLALLLVQDPDINAFVAPTDQPGMAYWAVFFNTGTLDANLTEDQMHGLIFHELGHLVKHHTSQEVSTRTRKVYVAEGGEPIGADEMQHDAARDVFERWLALAKLAGAYTSTDLADLPFGAYGDWLLKEFVNYIPTLPYPGYTCTDEAQRVQTASYNGTYSAYDQSLTLSSAHKNERNNAILALKTCLGTTAFTFKNLRDYLQPYAPEVFEGYTTADASTFDTMKAFDGLLALLGDRRARMRALQEELTTATGQPWSALRYYSIEEQADDISARITALTGISEVGVTGIMLAAIGSEATRCKSAVAAGSTIPYGENLEDDHHGSCWRVKHAEQFAEHVMDAARRLPVVRVPWVPTRVSTKPVY